MTARATGTLDAIVIGAGFAGIYQLYRFREAGLSCRVLERGSGVGGTWFWNRYPGARVDSPSMQYSLSFSEEMQQEWHWPETYSAQADLERYARHVVERFGLADDISLDTTVVSAVWDDEGGRWSVTTAAGEVLVARYVVCAVGTLSAPTVPDLPGRESFAGPAFHTSAWPEGLDLAGTRVGVVGTGSTGVQLIPVVAEQAAHLHVFQRSPNFTVPSQNAAMDPESEAEWKRSYADHREAARRSVSGFSSPAMPPRSALAATPEEREAIFEHAWHHPTQGPFGLLSTFSDIMTDAAANELLAEFLRATIRDRVDDPDVAERLTPRDHPVGTKRPVVEDGYYETFNRDDVTLVDVRADPIEEITPTGLRTASATYDLDVLVYATGFDAMTRPLTSLGLVGRDGVTLEEAWREGPRAYLGLATAGFPNLFMITAPGSPSVLSNIIVSIEQHVDLVTEAIRHAHGRGLERIEATEEAQERWVGIVAQIAGMTLYPQADSWYLGANIPGKPRVFMPFIGGVGTYRAACEYVVEHDYEGFVLS